MGGWTKDAAESLGGSEAGLKLILGRIFLNFDEDLDNLMLEFFLWSYCVLYHLYLLYGEFIIGVL